MYFKMDWEVKINDRKLAMIEAIEIHKSVDLLAATCVITLPGSAYGKALRVEDQVKRGDRVQVWLGYDREQRPSDFRLEFEGYLLDLGTDDGNLTFNCENDMFLLRKKVCDKQFKGASVKTIAEYLISQSGVKLTLECTLPINYEKFVISRATAFDVLTKIKEETNASIFIQAGKLLIHPPYKDKTGDVAFSFQKNIESSDLKYVRAIDKKIEVVVTSTSKDGKKREVRAGTTGGDQVKLSGYGMTEGSMKDLAEDRYRVLMTDGYEGSINGWLIPFVEPGFSAKITDEDYEYKDGKYFVNSVITNFSSSGGVRQTQLGIRLG